MKISYNQLKQYIDINYKVEDLSEILTDIGLEVEGTEEFESIKGGMEGLIIGEVKTCEKHPNADKLSITTVDTGTGELFPIVCGAPNVAAGQKVVVATVGTKLYFNDDEITIKKGKIRGEVSMGMICAEDEIGTGTSHEGILVLPEDVETGTFAKDYFKIEKDTIFEIGLTPNRADGASHLGVARDLIAYFKHQGKDLKLNKPDVSNFKVDNNNLQISVEIKNKDACKRYSGITISGIEIKESPDWLQNRLNAIGLQPINNVVDIANFVLHETGQPLHAFDADMIKGKKVIVRTSNEGTIFKTLDEEERKLHKDDLMICNAEEGMCIAGVFGGADSGVSDKTKNIFLESAYFNPVSVRKTSKRHALQTDSSFRFERGVDPNNTIYPLKRAALLIKELAGGSISSEIVDVYPEPIQDFKFDVLYSHIDRLIGKKIEHDEIDTILEALEIKITDRDGDRISLEVPPYRVDVTREADIVEEILRIYGYNSIDSSTSVKSTLAYAPKPDTNKLKNTISAFLSSQGFSEAMSNSLTKGKYYEADNDFKEYNSVKILNALSNDLNVMRQDLLFGSLEAVIRNVNHKNPDIKLYEFGQTYKYKKTESENPLNSYFEEQHLAVTISGNKNKVNWNSSEEASDFYYLKSKVTGIFERFNFDINKLKSEETESDIFAYGITHTINNKKLVEFGSVSNKFLSVFGIEQEVFYADIHWDGVIKYLPETPKFIPVPKYPAVKRDLALLLNKDVKFSQIEQLAYRSERKLLKNVSIFDVFEDEKLGKNKKSYAVSFIIQDETKTLKDKQIDKIMKKLQYTFEKELGAELR
ncbi:MAG: phenylalanine--tRNA ligase subunit beta [Bacteroidales bacterium]|nr:phenylalanine--tRNA ligase subunit beta [Bacteroidales bacterium]